MRISQRLLILFILIAFAFGAFFYLFFHIKQEELRVFAESDLQQRRTTIDAIFELKANNMLTILDDYAIRDEMIRFTRGQSSVWTSSAASSILRSFGYSMVQIYDTKGNILFQETDDAISGLQDWRLDPVFLEGKASGIRQSFFTKHRQIILSCAISSIHSSSNLSRSDTPAGYILIAQAWDYRFLVDLAKSLNYDIRISYTEPTQTNSPGQYNTKIVRSITGVDNEILAWLVFYSSNPYLAELRNLGNIIIFGTMGFILIFLLMQFFLIQQWITTPLGLISQSLKKNDPHIIHVLNDKGNEFADVALLIERFFAQQEKLIQEIEERSRTEARLREIEEQTRKILLTSPESIIVTDLDGYIISVNDETLRLLKQKSEQDILQEQQKISDLVIPSEHKHLKRMMQDLFKGLYVKNQELSFQTKEGERFAALLSASVIMDDSNNPTKLIFITRDLTDLKNLELQLRQSQKMESIGTLAGGIAHDFNNIITIIAGYIALSAGKIDHHNEAQEDLDEALKACLRGKSLIGKILTFSRQSEPDVEEAILADIIEDTLPMIRAIIPSKISIETDIRSYSYTRVDNTEMQQVLLNLATNAFHAMRPDGGTLSICLEEIPGFEIIGIDSKVQLESNYLHLTVTDTGTGIAPELLSRIFDPYFSTKATGEGTGLGLSIVHGIVSGYHGFITVRSIQGEGTDFSIYLPVTELLNPNPRQSRSEEYPFQEANILMVDDEPALAEIFLQALTNSGYQVQSYTDSTKALQAFMENPQGLDLVIADINMPMMDGIKLATEILAIRTLPIILYTGFLDATLQRKAESAGVSFILNKPIMPDEMIKAVKKALYVFRGDQA
ncbi:MAG: ATP-binding protein [Candidatus Cloacimonadaceae bacterium]|jgi:PAS domain S-box-containing protein|nr:response regulator [Candidatus Cloacimonadota bacterium]MDD2543694.1 response regulator [Candidatus Cloacimonadota bacterium]MDD4667408.1 response regulator [Candidatus Cloacimonadota bacterium]MDY0337107.1 response regulator [Candidatus Cloacimonadaceae bacterium]